MTVVDNMNSEILIVWVVTGYLPLLLDLPVHLSDAGKGVFMLTFTYTCICMYVCMYVCMYCYEPLKAVTCGGVW